MEQYPTAEHDHDGSLNQKGMAVDRLNTGDTEADIVNNGECIRQARVKKTEMEQFHQRLEAWAKRAKIDLQEGVRRLSASKIQAVARGNAARHRTLTATPTRARGDG